MRVCAAGALEVSHVPRPQDTFKTLRTHFPSLSLPFPWRFTPTESLRLHRPPEGGEKSPPSARAGGSIRCGRGAGRPAAAWVWRRGRHS